MSLFDLVLRSMWKNIRHYYLYFFALIFSVTLYFVFATLQFDSAVIEEKNNSGSFESAFHVAGILLIFIAGIFVFYANAIFLKRRSREIGIYQLIGLTKGNVTRLLIIENTLLSVGALLIGIGVGALLSRLFLLLLMKLVGFEGFIALSFSPEAAIQTMIVFVVIIFLTSVQMVIAVFRNTLLNLFNAEKMGEHPKKPKSISSTFLAVLGIGFIAFGYWLSGRMLNMFLFLNMILVLFFTILGTYLVFRVTISWLLYWIRRKKNGHLGLYNILSLAPLMHKMKGNANSLTIITVLSAMTLTMISISYSLYYSTETETRMMMPYDFMFENEELNSNQFKDELNSEGIEFNHAPLEMFSATAAFNDNKLPPWMNDGNLSILVTSEEQLTLLNHVPSLQNGVASFYDTTVKYILENIDLPIEMSIIGAEKVVPITIGDVGNGNILNWSPMSSQIVVNEQTYNELKGTHMNDGSALQRYDVFTITNEEDLIKASEVFNQPKYQEISSPDFYTMYVEKMQTNGLLIFITGFLGLVFLVSTGSILYFKQMTEAEQERQSYTTLRQLGFNVQEIMRGIIRKQLFVFGIPLAIGLLHSVFAIKAAYFLFATDVTVPATIAMSVYVLIYLIFAFLSVGYYRKTVVSTLK